MKVCLKCKSVYSLLEDRSFHQLPKDAGLRTKWINILQLSQLKKRVLVCSDHFSKECFYPMFEGQRTARLIPGALSNGFYLTSNQLPVESSVKNDIPKQNDELMIVEVQSTDLSDDDLNNIAGPSKRTVSTKTALGSERSKLKYEDQFKTKRVRFALRYKVNFLSRSDFTSDEDWNKFLKFKMAQDLKLAAAYNIRHQTRKKY